MNRVVAAVRPCVRAHLGTSRIPTPSIRSSSTRSLREKDSFNNLYNAVFKNNMAYVTYIIAGAIVLDFSYGTFTDFIWETNNRGRLYHHIDWSKFKTDDDEEEKEDEDEDEE